MIYFVLQNLKELEAENDLMDIKNLQFSAV